MAQGTIAEAVVAVLMERGQPMTAAAITEAIIEQGLYSFSCKDVVGTVRSAIVRRCEGSSRKDVILPTLFRKKTYKFKLLNHYFERYFQNATSSTRYLGSKNFD